MQKNLIYLYVSLVDERERVRVQLLYNFTFEYSSAEAVGGHCVVTHRRDSCSMPSDLTQCSSWNCSLHVCIAWLGPCWYSAGVFSPDTVGCLQTQLAAL